MVPITCLADWRLPDEQFLAEFKLPGPSERCFALSAKNPMARENRIVFHEESHRYTVDGIQIPRSVTGLVHAYQASHFDPMVAIEAMKRGKNWAVKMEEFINEEGDCMSDAEICNVWQHRGKVASARGTLLHFHAECHLNGLEIEKPHSPEFKNFLLIGSLQKPWAKWGGARSELRSVWRTWACVYVGNSTLHSGTKSESFAFWIGKIAGTSNSRIRSDR